MPRIHPRADVLQSIVESLADSKRDVLLHVMECDVCRELLCESLRADRQPASPPTPAGRILPWRQECRTGRVVDSVLRRFRDRHQAIEREQAEAPALLAELLRRPAGERHALMRAEPRFQTLSLCDLLARASQEECFRNARAAEELARLGLELSSVLSPMVHGARLIADVQIRCWGAVGNACRIAADLQSADHAFAAARELLSMGTGDRLERARLLVLESSLRRAQRRFALADSLLRHAMVIYRKAGESHLLGEATLARGVLLKEAGDPETAITLLQEADRLIDRRQNPRLELCVYHNLADWLTEAGRCFEASAVLVRSRRLYESFRDPPSRLRRLWVEGKVAAGFGRWEEAARLFASVFDGFAAEQLAYDAGLAGLDLAIALSQLGRTAEVRILAAQVLPVFRARDLPRETLAALLVFERAAVEAPA